MGHVRGMNRGEWVRFFKVELEGRKSNSPGIGGANEAVTGEAAEVVGSEVGGYGIFNGVIGRGDVAVPKFRIEINCE